MIAFLLLPVILQLVPSGLSYPADENIMGENSALVYPEGSLPATKPPKGCFHFYVSRNMSSLLSEATKMLPQVRDRREREWILTFIYRIKSLAEHLRTHPSSRNYDCIASDPRDALYFVDDLPQKRSGDNQQPPRVDHPTQDLSQPEESPGTVQAGSHQGYFQTRDQKDASHQDFAESRDQKDPSQSDSHQEKAKTQQDSVQAEDQKDSEHAGSHQEQSEVHHQGTAQSGHQEADIVISSSPDCEENAECEEALSRQAATRGTARHSDDLLVQELHSKLQEKSHQEEDRIQQKALKERIRKALLQEMAPEVKKLRTVGGSEEDLLNLWRQSETDTAKPSENYYEFDYEETGTAAGDLNDVNDSSTPSEHTVAPSLGDIKRQSNKGRVTTKVYEPYDDSDVLVKQLFDVRFEQSKTTKSSQDRKEEYLITSTHVPY